MASVMYSEYTEWEGGEVQDRLLLKKLNFFFIMTVYANIG